MKTSENIRELISFKMKLMENSNVKSKEFRAAKRDFDFFCACLLLLENNCTEESVDRMIEKLSSQYQRMRQAFYREFWDTRSDKFKQENKRPSAAKFESRTGANKIKQQLKTYKFLKE